MVGDGSYTSECKCLRRPEELAPEELEFKAVMSYLTKVHRSCARTEVLIIPGPSLQPP